RLAAQMLALCQAVNRETASLKNSCLGDRDVVEAAGTLRNGCLAVVEGLDESPAELRHLREGVWLTSLIDHGEGRPLGEDHAFGHQNQCRYVTHRCFLLSRRTLRQAPPPSNGPGLNLS